MEYFQKVQNHKEQALVLYQLLRLRDFYQIHSLGADTTFLLEWEINGSGLVIDAEKTFTGTWNLYTGNPLQQINYRFQNYLNADKTKYENNIPAYFIDGTEFITVQYIINEISDATDIALLTITGYNLATGLSIRITGQNI